jgi:hypothetical protein
MRLHPGVLLRIGTICLGAALLCLLVSPRRSGGRSGFWPIATAVLFGAGILADLCGLVLYLYYRARRR